ncbi:ATP-grasp fold, subdomain 1 [Penicillium griseofulvum]|uniref:ATP-grasp fold, subdomain 1 n=1 Tax=Penicillium patulum TaxID=5078 RepID=A0A135LAY3_PENPA|nr:ATP-grasp fold, subdomain 1 [Penicillium griseofulvum]KXG46135.1 ATP-grasp fold, subdomain 1 [Penicillium griseofulvum]
MEPLVIPFFYESFSLYRSRGYSVEDCVELDKEETIDAVVQSLRKNGFEVVPVGDIKELIHCIARGEHERWDLAFSISEGMHGVGREAQVPGVLEAYQIPHVFSDAATLSLCLDKGKTKMVLEHMGIPTAPFAVVPSSWSIEKGISQILDQSRHAETLKQMPLFIKPACEGSSKGIYPFSKVESIQDLEQGVQKLQTRFPGQSILIEKYLAGREYTTSILGSGDSARVIGTVHHNWEGIPPQQGTEAKNFENNSSNGDFYSFDNKNAVLEDPVDRMINGDDSSEVQGVERLALDTWRKLECCDVGRVDVRCGLEGKPYVLEVNPIPGLRPKWSWLADTALHHGMTHEDLLGAVVDCALERYPGLNSKRRGIPLGA